MGKTVQLFMAATMLLITAAAAQSAERAPLEEMSPLDAAVLGVVEGATEYLPVSSTGHLILASYFMGLSRFTEDEYSEGVVLEKAPALDAFQIIIQAGAILAVLGIYRRRIKDMLRGVLGKHLPGLRLLGLLLTAFFPAAAIGLLFQSAIKEHLFNPGTVAVALAVGGAVMIVVNYRYRRQADTSHRMADVMSLSFRQAFVIGLFQCLALCPGMSRSMVTIVGGVAVGLNMAAAAEFSFLLALPTLGGATFYEGITELHMLRTGVGLGQVAIGIAVSAIVAAISVEWLVYWLHRHGLTPFGIYRMAVAVAVAVAFLA